MSTRVTVRAGQVAPHIEANTGAGQHDPRPFGIYARKSKRIAGDGQGARLTRERQDAASVEYGRRIDPDAEFVFYWDNMSGWDPDAKRDDYDQMQADLANGVLRGSIAWHIDRYTRQPEQLLAQLRHAQMGGATVHTVVGGAIDSHLTPTILVAVAKEESDQRSRRTMAKHKQLAEHGYTSGGRRRFGYTDHTMMEVDETEAAIIRDLIARLLKGESLGSLARSLEERGIRTPEWTEEKPTVWRGPNVRHLLARPHLAGLRAHTPKGSDVTTLYPAKWKAIISEATHDAVTEYLDAPGRRTNFVTSRKYLLTGLAVCDVCGTKLKGRPLHKAKKQGKDTSSYYCGTGKHFSRVVEYVDAAVEARVIELLSRHPASGALIDDKAADEVSELETERRALTQKLEDLTERNLSGRLSDEQLERSTKAADKRIAAIDIALADARKRVRRPAAVLDKMTGERAAQAWEAAPLDRKRAVLSYLYERIAIKPSGKGFRFKPEDVVMERRRVG